jgi:hypothetical protein
MADERDLDRDEEYQEVEGQIHHVDGPDDDDLIEIDISDVVEVSESRGTDDAPTKRKKMLL